MKQLQIEQLIRDLSINDSCANLRDANRDVGLVSDFYKESFISNFPDIWFDWRNRTDAKIMIIGQDWGPYSAMVRIKEEFESKLQLGEISSENLWQNFINSPKDMTTKKLKASLLESAKSKNVLLDDCFN